MNHNPVTHHQTATEFTAWALGKTWPEINPIFSHDYEALAYIGEMPWKQRPFDSRIDYEMFLGHLLNWIRSGVRPTPLLELHNRWTSDSLDKLHADLTARGQWPARGSV